MSADPFERISQLNERAVHLFQQGAYEEALGHAESALALGRRYLPDSDPELATLLGVASQLYLAVGRLADAEPLAVECLECLEEHGGGYDIQVALAVNNLAGIYHEQGRLRDAAPLFERAAAIFRHISGEEDPNYAQAIHNLAAVYGDLGDYEKALQLSEEAVHLRRRVLGESDALYASSLSNLGGLYFESGHFERAMDLFTKSAAIIRRTKGENHPAIALGLQIQGGYFHSTGNFEQALPLLQKSLEIWRNILPVDHPDIAKGLHNLGGLYLDMGSYEKAEPLYLEALAIRRKQLGDAHPSTAHTLNSMAGLYDHMGRRKDAERLFRESMEMRLTSVGPDHPDYAQSLHNLACFYKDTGNGEAALPLFNEALRVYRHVWGDRHPDVATVLNGLGVLHRALGEMRAAESCHREALKIRHAVFGEDHPVVAHSVINLAIVLGNTGRISEALSLTKWAVSIETRLIEQIFAVTAEDQRRDYLETLRQSTVIFASLTLAEPRESDAIGDLLDLVLRRKGIEAEALAIERSSVLGRRFPHLREKLRDVDTLRIQISRKKLEGPGREGLVAHHTLLQEWLERKERLEEELVRDIPELKMDYRFLSVDRSSIAEVLPSDTVLVEFVHLDVVDFYAAHAGRRTDARYVALLLAAHDAEDVQMIDLGDAGAIDEMIAAVRAAMTQHGAKRDIEVCEERPSQQSVVEAARELRCRVFDPIREAVGSRTRLLIAPDGQLNILPFEILPLDDERFVIDDFAISYLSSGRDLLRLRISSGMQPSDPLIVADPDYDLASNSGEERVHKNSTMPLMSDQAQSELRSAASACFVSLPATASEAHIVSKIIGNATVWLRGEALDGKIKRIRSPRFLHFATHGIFLKDRSNTAHQESDVGLRSIRIEAGECTVAGMGNPLLRSCLALAGANTWWRQKELPADAEDGILTAEEVTGIDLVDTEMVVLSACDTGLGDIRSMEGVYGLRRAFVLAGARSVVMSLWKVPDTETQELMQRFYKHLMAGSGRADALRHAQLELRAKMPHPFFWGAFICQGDLSPVLNRN